MFSDNNLIRKSPENAVKKKKKKLEVVKNIFGLFFDLANLFIKYGKEGKWGKNETDCREILNNAEIRKNGLSFVSSK